jgi:hypothetical protein
MNKYWLLLALPVFGVGYWAGSSNPKVITKTETVEVIKEVERIVEVEKKNIDTVTKRKVVSKPDGTTVVKEKIVDRTVVEREAEKESKRESEAKETIAASLPPKWNVGMMVTDPIHFMDRRMTVGAYAQYRLLGPFTVGAAVQNNLSYSLLLGVTF